MRSKTNIDNTALLQAASESLESLVFSEVGMVQSLEFNHVPSHAHIGLGDHGHLELWVEDEVLKNLASIIYSAESELVNEQMAQDTLLEILNIIAGRLCNNVLKDGDSFDLGLPEWQPNFKDVEASNQKVVISLDDKPAMKLAWWQ